jgi:hypothetical protein
VVSSIRGNRLNKIKIGIGFPVEAVFVLIITTEFAPPLRAVQDLSYPLGVPSELSPGIKLTSNLHLVLSRRGD